MIGWLIAVAPSTVAIVLGSLYALFFDPKSTLPKGSIARLK